MPALPFVFLNTAITADGKIAPAGRRFIPFGSPRDRRHMLELRATADAVICGARTADAFPVNLGPGPAKYRRLRLQRGLAEYNLRVIVSGAGTIDPGAEIFRHRFSPIIILTTARVSPARLRRLRAVADEVKIFGRRKLNLPAALRWLREKRGVKRLLFEGGGELNAALFKAGLVHEIHLTICPFIYGGRDRAHPVRRRGSETPRPSRPLSPCLHETRRRGTVPGLRRRETPSPNLNKGVSHRRSPQSAMCKLRPASRISPIPESAIRNPQSAISQSPAPDPRLILGIWKKSGWKAHFFFDFCV